MGITGQDSTGGEVTQNRQERDLCEKSSERDGDRGNGKKRVNSLKGKSEVKTSASAGSSRCVWPGQRRPPPNSDPQQTASVPPGPAQRSPTWTDSGPH
ncbi:hypothetical protein AAFF_G00036360 [Aldrovandia affinis]|uniref:Uncharacterized protein n=1 Tax=Aldrovandia affinis TaxID=143900 RepID=A0AAD7S3E8_9TELE|nr:hypothetical protein AAFF_G00036360 [Aldrovandia affinis]